MLLNVLILFLTSLPHCFVIVIVLCVGHGLARRVFELDRELKESFH